MDKKITIISGASRGIGRAVSLRLAHEGHFVIVLARNAEEIGELEHEIDEAGGKALAIACDISDEKQVEEAVNQVIRDFKRIDCVVNNAGIGVFKHADQLEADDWDRVMDINVKGSFLLTKAVLPHMKAVGKGHILGIASDVSKRTFAGGSLYTASKYAQHAFFESLRREVRSLGIKVSVVYPGLVDTYFHGEAQGEVKQAEYLHADDIAQAVSYILNTPPHVLVDEIMLHPMCQEW
ncbi:MAG TPA: NAD(P)-dependent oxidoreductase [Saprospirales bacterium]|nr:NAD(P)-dependent oxidoreductase [Saprospirales bacterium]